MLYRGIIAFCSQIHTKHINTLCGQSVEFLNVKLVVHIVTTRLQRVICKELYTFSSYRAVNTLPLGYKTSQLMLYREIIAVCSEIHTKHINTLWAECRIFKQACTWEIPCIFPHQNFRDIRCVNVSRCTYVTCKTPVAEKLPKIQGDRI